MADFWLGASALFTDPTALMIFAGGLLGGMLFGAIPGINMLTLGAVILPFTAAMEPAHAIMLYSVIYCSGVFGGAITAILFNIPGSPENAPTAFDGYPMTQNGEAAKAIGAAVLCSAFGGICSAILMMAATPTIAGWAVRAFGPPEIFSLICFGLAVSASVGAADLWKGLLSVSLGLLIATIGTDPADGIARYNFGTYYLLAGIHFIPVVLGLFAVAEVFTQGAKRLTDNPAAAKVKLSLPSFFEFWRLKITVLRSMVIGFFAGILPGIGAVLAAFLSYNEAVRWGPKEKFGKGELGGVVASETANNSATGAAMIPLLALGLPGGALTAMMMGVFQIHGMEPGPLVLITSKELVWIVFAAMFFANVAILGLGYIQTKTVVHLLRIPFHLLAPAILLIATIGAYALRNLTVDIWVMYLAGIAGFYLRKSGYSVAGIVMGLILGKLGESSFTKSMQLLNYEPLTLFTRPIAALLLTAAMATLIWNISMAVKRSGQQRTPDLAGTENKGGAMMTKPAQEGTMESPETVIAGLIERANAAMDAFDNTSQQAIDDAVTALAWSIYKPENARRLAELAVESTGLGNADDKVIKNQRKTFGTLRDLMRVRTTGVIEEQPERGLVKYGKPIGVVAAITPSTNPAATPVNKAMMALKGGNAVIIAPSPAGYAATAATVNGMRAELAKVGAPSDLVQIVPAPVDRERTKVLMQKSDLIVCTGSQNNVRNAYSSGTPAIGVGAGNVPVIIDESADLASAAEKITASKIFDNATSCSSENSVIIVDEVYDDAIRALVAAGGYMTSPDEGRRVIERLWVDGKLNRKVIAKDAAILAEVFDLPSNAGSARFFMVEEAGIGPDHPLSGEKLSLVLTVYRARDFLHAKELASDILEFQGKGHSLGLHTNLVERARELAEDMPVVRVLVNQAHTFANGGGFDTGLPFTLSMGCGSWGGNSIAENLNYRHFINITHLVTSVDEDKPTEDALFGKYWEKYGQ